MGVKVTNNAFGTISAGISSSDTTVVLDSGQGARFPTLGSGDYFYGTLIDTSNNIEIIKVTARSTDSMTVTRAQDNTTARAFAIGDRFELRPTAALFGDIAELANDTSPQLSADLDTQTNTIDMSAHTGALKIPVGTTAQRPGSPAAGMLRQNSTENKVEVYNGTAWELVGDQSSTYEIQYLVIAGGGGGGPGYQAGGGGAGGYRTNVTGQNSGGGAGAETTLEVSKGTNYTCTVGAGGAGGSAINTSSTEKGDNGSNSVFGQIASTGGGGGASYWNGSSANGKAGGSGGGAGSYSTNTNGGAGTSGQGYAGGSTNGYASPYCGGGGGGAGAVGTTAGGSNLQGHGGAGVSSNITGSAVTRGGGGGGGGFQNAAGNAGSGGGGAGGIGGSGMTDGTVNTGGGGGAPGSTNTAGKNGGSGIIILRYLGSQRGSGGTVTSSGGYTIHTFTSSGTYTA